MQVLKGKYIKFEGIPMLRHPRIAPKFTAACSSFPLKPMPQITAKMLVQMKSRCANNFQPRVECSRKSIFAAGIGKSLADAFLA
jgi:hypothetical protein